MRIDKPCPACGCCDCQTLINMGQQPMSLVAMQNTAGQSDCLERYPIYIAICPACRHCFNMDFRYVNYTGDGCRMWNNGSGWADHVRYIADAIENECANAECVMEIGAGDGAFLESLDHDGVKIAIDPAKSVLQCEERGIHYVRELFDASKHVPKGCGDLVIIMRHLLEHMENPQEFLMSIADHRRHLGNWTQIAVEVPNIEMALDSTRLEDWTYEHPQHFTMLSLERLMARCGFEGETSREYGDEVLLFIGSLTASKTLNIDGSLDRFAKMSLNAAKVGGQLAGMQSVAYWGGAGKSAMFLNYLGVGDDALVVDSDPNKIGMYVPGTCIQIQDPTKLLIDHVDTIVITTSWRAQDIAAEIHRRRIPCNKLLTFADGELKEVTPL